MKILIALLLSFPFTVFAQQWQEIAPVPGGGRDDGVAFYLGDAAYVVTGSLSGFVGSNRLWRYDLESDSWSEKTAFPGSPRQYCGSFVLNNEGYVLCGVGEGDIPVNDCWKYNSTTDTWIRIADLPAAPRWSVFSFASPFAGYLGTGASSGSLLKDFWKYNPGSDSWTQLPDYPGGQFRETACFSIGEKGVVTLGYNENYEFSNTTYEFNMFSETWKQTSDFPGVGRAYATGGSTNDYGYVAAGTTKQTEFFNDVLKYNPSTGFWSEAGNLPVAIRGLSSFSTGKELFFVTGLDSDIVRVGRGWKIPFVADMNVDPDFFPNPSEGKLIIKAKNESTIRILTMDGKVYKELKTVSENTVWIDQLNSGTYIVEIITDNDKTTEKLVVN